MVSMASTVRVCRKFQPSNNSVVGGVRFGCFIVRIIHRILCLGLAPYPVHYPRRTESDNHWVAPTPTHFSLLSTFFSLSFSTSGLA